MVSRPKAATIRERMRRVVGVECRLHAVAVRREAGCLLGLRSSPHPEVREREIVLSERGLDEARDTLEREPRIRRRQRRMRANARLVQRFNAGPERLEHRLPQYARRVHVAFEAKVSDEFVHITYVEHRLAKPALHVQFGQSARQWSRLSTSSAVRGAVDTRKACRLHLMFGKSLALPINSTTRGRMDPSGIIR